jgi:hypothetical protein
MQNIPKHIQERLIFISPPHSGSSKNDIPNETVPHKKLIKPYTHWSHQCKSCNMFQCQKTGKFTLTNIELRNQHNEIAGKKPVKPYGPPPGNAKIGRPLGAKNKKKSVLLDK